MVKVVLLGNCQTTAMGHILPKIARDVEVTQIVPALGTPEFSYENYRASLDEADLIISHSIKDNFAHAWMGRTNLVSQYGGKALFATNLYFDGYAPELCFFHDGAGQRHVLPGPLNDVHLKTIIYAYQTGMDVDQTLGLMEDADFFATHYASVAQRSLAELRRREALSDVKLADFIQERFRERRLFFTFNHPTSYLVAENCTRLLKLAGVRVDYDISEILNEEYLSITIKSVPLPVYNEQRMTFNNPPFHRGLGMDFVDNKHVMNWGLVKYYSSRELIEGFYDVYRHNHDAVMAFPLNFSELAEVNGLMTEAPNAAASMFQRTANTIGRFLKR